MANENHLSILTNGVKEWNNWREENSAEEPDFFLAYLDKAILTGAKFHLADFRGAILRGADLKGVNFFGANLLGADLAGADLTGANLSLATLSNTNLEGAILKNCKIYGINVWGCKGEIVEQKDLIITPENEPEVTVDNIKIAQFIYLLLENKEIRNVIDALTSKAVLILGRFTAERKAVLDAIKDELRKRDYLPILFDFEKSASRNFTETIKSMF